MNTFSTIAAYYDVLTNSTKRLEREGPLLLNCLNLFESKKVIDIACGTGLHSHFLAEHGARVTAVDVSPEMLEYAKKHRKHEHIQFVCSDMRMLPLGMWDMAICLGNSLSVLQDPTDLRKVFLGVGERLNPNGVFITQTLNYAATAALKPRHRVEQLVFEGAPLVAVKSLVPVRGQTLVSMQFFVNRGGEWQQTADWGLLRNWERDDILDAAVFAGLQVEQVLGSFDQNPYDAETSSDIVCLFRKKVKT